MLVEIILAITKEPNSIFNFFLIEAGIKILPRSSRVAIKLNKSSQLCFKVLTIAQIFHLILFLSFRYLNLCGKILSEKCFV
ncbi:MAG: hypothetical protein ACP5O8_03280 [Candidatus Aenigmatarchaeota archaeon]